MQQTIFLLEDDISQIESLNSLVKEYNKKYHTNYHIISNYSFNDAKKNVDTLKTIDIFFIDIILSDENKNFNGIEFAKYVRSFLKYETTPIFFLTAYSGFMPAALNQIHCFAFLLKPYRPESLYQQLQELPHTRNTELTIKNLDGIYIKLPFDSLLYVKSHGRYLKYVTKDSIFHSRQYTMQKLEHLLPDFFCRCHKSYIVNSKYIKNYDFTNHYIHLAPIQKVIPMSRKLTTKTIIQENY